MSDIAGADGPRPVPNIEEPIDVRVTARRFDTFKRQAIFWLLAFAAFIGFLVVFRAILLPFLAGMALAYFLDPVADRLEAWGLSRLAATLLILVMFLVLFAAALLGIIPSLAEQAAGLIERLPTYIAGLQNLIAGENSWLRTVVGEPSQALEDNLNAILTEGAGFISGLFASIWAGGQALVDVIGLFVVTPVVAFYLLLDWDRMVARIDELTPRDHVGTIRKIARDIDNAVAGFVRGQGTVCLILGAIYGIGLTLVGLNFGLLIGLVAGLISFIPYVGSIVGLVMAVGVALVQFWPEGEYLRIGLVLAVFFAGQFFEGNILQPKLVGGRVGLHPVWLMFALFAFGSLFGFTGLLIAVPASAALGVLVRFAVARYEESEVYRGHDDEAPVDREATRGQPWRRERNAAFPS